MPFTVGYVPSGYLPLQTGTHAMPGLSGIATARAGDYGGATYTRPAAPTSGLTAPYDAAEGAIKDGFHIFVTPSSSANQSPEPGATKCYPGADRRLAAGGAGGGFCNIWSADGTVSLQVSGMGLGNALPLAELEKIARGIRVADVRNESTLDPGRAGPAAVTPEPRTGGRDRLAATATAALCVSAVPPSPWPLLFRPWVSAGSGGSGRHTSPTYRRVRTSWQQRMPRLPSMETLP